MRWYVENRKTEKRINVTFLVEDLGNPTCPEDDLFAWACDNWSDTDPKDIDVYAEEG